MSQLSLKKFQNNNKLRLRAYSTLFLRLHTHIQKLFKLEDECTKCTYETKKFNARLTSALRKIFNFSFWSPLVHAFQVLRAFFEFGVTTSNQIILCCLPWLLIWITEKNFSFIKKLSFQVKKLLQATRALKFYFWSKVSFKSFSCFLHPNRRDFILIFWYSSVHLKAKK